MSGAASKQHFSRAFWLPWLLRLVSSHLSPRSFPYARADGVCMWVQIATSSGEAGGHPLASALGLLDLPESQLSHFLAL